MTEAANKKNSKLSERAERRMAFSMRIVLSFLTVVCFGFAGFWYHINYTAMSWYCGITGSITLALMVYPLFRLTIIQTAHLLLVVVLQFAFVASALTWSQSQIMVGYFAALLIGILIFLGHRVALFWAVICAIAIISLPWASAYFYLPPGFASIANVFNVFNGLCIVFISLIMVYLSESFSKTLLSELIISKRNLESTQENLLKVQRYRNRFFSSISHEIRTPMNAVRGISELLSHNHDLTSDDAILVESLHRSSTHLLNIINDLLDIGKLEENKLRFIEADFDLREIFYDARTIVKYSASEKNLDFKMQLDTELPKFVRGDQNRLRQVLVNLLSNAVKFTEVGHVALRCKVLAPEAGHGERLLMEIEDTGIGISPELHDNIFDGYVQADVHISQQYGGTGLGLNICKRIVEYLGGKIWYESTPNQGSTFFVELPLHRSNSIHGVVNKVRHEAFTIDWPCRVLLADDNKINLLVGQRQLKLRMPKATFIMAENGQEVLNQLDVDALPDIILMDMHMPEMDGLHATKLIRAHEDERIREIPIIAMTANTSEEDVENCFAVGMNDFMSKPFDVNTLLLKISHLCTAKKSN